MLSTQKDLIFPDLSYAIVGVLYEVYNQLGSGFQEKYYQRAIAGAFQKKNIIFEREVCIPLQYDTMNIGHYYLDFLIDGKVILEVKSGEYFARGNIDQVIRYLKATNKQLGILANFTRHGVIYKRILSIHSYIRRDS